MPDRVRSVLLRFALLFSALIATTAQAQGPAHLRQRAEALVSVLNGEPASSALFSAEFLLAVPPERLAAIAGQIRVELGKAQRISRINPPASGASAIIVEYERGWVEVRLAVASAPPHLISGLFVTATRRRTDSSEAIAADVRALPGSSAFALARIGDKAPGMLIAADAEVPLAIGSIFKLFVLAELDRQVQAGERRWTDVVPLTRRSLPSGLLQDWPAGSPVTLHSLAALMISRSDNSATDTLLHLVGRERVEALLPTLGIRDPRNRPFLSTLEAFVLKGGDDVLTRRWLAADEIGRRALLAELAATGPERVDLALLQARPIHIDRIEWFASPADLVRALDWLRRNAAPETLAMLSINPGLPRQVSPPFRYWGFKGGSETGVVAMAFLVQALDGAWYALATGWNDPNRPVDEQLLARMASRAITMISPSASLWPK